MSARGYRFDSDETIVQPTLGISCDARSDVRPVSASSSRVARSS